jgi:hypothetical protein
MVQTNSSINMSEMHLEPRELHCIFAVTARKTPDARTLVGRRSTSENQAGIFGGDRYSFAWNGS